MSMYMLGAALGQTPDQMVAEANRQVAAAQQQIAEATSVAARAQEQIAAAAAAQSPNLMLIGGVSVAAIMVLWLARRSGWI